MASIKRNLAYNFFLSVSNVMLPLLSIPYVSRVLDPEGIGRVGFIDSFTYYFVIIAEFGITTYGIREIAKCGDDKVRLKLLIPQLLTLHLISCLVTSVVYLIAVWMLWDKFGDPRLIYFSVAFFFVNFFACEWYFMGREQFGFIALRSITVRALGLAMIFLLVHSTEDYYLYYAVIVGAAVLNAIWNFAALLKEFSFSFMHVSWRQHLRFVWVTYLISLFYSVPLLLDDVVIGLTSTAAMVGIYSLSVRMVRTGSTLLTDSFLVFFPRVVSLSTEMKYGQLVQKLSLNIQFIVLFGVPMSVGLYLVTDELAVVFFGDQFASTGVNLRILCAYPVIKGISLFLSNPVLIAHHHEKSVLKNLACSSIVYLLVASIMSYRFGALGACVALIFSELLLMLLNLLSVRRLLPIVPFSSLTILHAFIASAPFIAIHFVLRNAVSFGPLRLSLMIVCCIIAYTLVLALLGNELVMRIRRLLKGQATFDSADT